MSWLCQVDTEVCIAFEAYTILPAYTIAHSLYKQFIVCFAVFFTPFFCVNEDYVCTFWVTNCYTFKVFADVINCVFSIAFDCSNQLFCPFKTLLRTLFGHLLTTFRTEET